jgi:hypothetical protein
LVRMDMPGGAPGRLSVHGWLQEPVTTPGSGSGQLQVRGSVQTLVP